MAFWESFGINGTLPFLKVQSAENCHKTLVISVYTLQFSNDDNYFYNRENYLESTKILKDLSLEGFDHLIQDIFLALGKTLFVQI